MNKLTRQVTLFLGVALLTTIVYAGLVAFAGPKSHYFNSDGVSIHYSDEGQGTPVILVHGFAANANLNWRIPGIIDLLKQDYRVIAIDARAHGYSGKPHEHGRYGMNMVDDIARLMDHLKIEKAHLAGYSMGGFLSLAFAGKYPDRLLSLTQGGSGWYPRDEYPDLVTTVPASLDQGNGLEPIVRFMEPPDAWFRELRIPVVNFVLCWVNDEKAMARCFQEMVDLEGSEEQLRANRVPTLTIMGTKDPLRKSAEMITGRAANHRTHWIEGADHLSTLGSPTYLAEFKQAFRSFLAENDRAILAANRTSDRLF